MKIGILMTGRVPGELTDEYGELDGFFRDLLAGRGFTFQTYAVLDGQIPTAPDACEGWLITGSRYAVYEDHDWLPPLEEFLRAAFAVSVPIIGICFGHQLLAKALGGHVAKYEGGWALGPWPYESAALGDHCVVAFHQDQVLTPPEGAQVLASGPACANAALLYEGRALTLQAHPEFTTAYLRDLCRVRANILPADALQRADLQAPLTSPRFAQIFESFFKHRQLPPPPKG